MTTTAKKDDDVMDVKPTFNITQKHNSGKVSVFVDSGETDLNRQSKVFIYTEDDFSHGHTLEIQGFNHFINTDDDNIKIVQGKIIYKEEEFASPEYEVNTFGDETITIHTVRKYIVKEWKSAFASELQNFALRDATSVVRTPSEVREVRSTNTVQVQQADGLFKNPFVISATSVIATLMVVALLTITVKAIASPRESKEGAIPSTQAIQKQEKSIFDDTPINGASYEAHKQQSAEAALKHMGVDLEAAKQQNNLSCLTKK